MINTSAQIMSATTTQILAGEQEREAPALPFPLLAEPYYGPVYHFLLGQVARREDAADLTQEVFLKALKAFHRFDPQREFAPWIFTIARRCVADFYRQRGRPQDTLDEALADPSPDPHESAARSEGAEAIWEQASRLKPNQHQVLLLHYKESFSLEETARIMGISQTYAKVLLFRARSALKGRLSAHPPTIGIAQ